MTTIKNDLTTLRAVHQIYLDSLDLLRHKKIKGLVWTLVLQPLSTTWLHMGDDHVLCPRDGSNETLIIVSFTVNWNESQDDVFVKTTVRQTVEQMENWAANNNTAHSFKYTNYRAEWQNSFSGYGEDNLRFMRDVSRKHDPQEFFQRASVGGF